MSTDFKQRLKELIREKECSQLDLAKKINVTRQGISRYLIGETVPNATKIIDIANYFEVTTDYLLGLSNVRDRNPKAEKLEYMYADWKELKRTTERSIEAMEYFIKKYFEVGGRIINLALFLMEEEKKNEPTDKQPT